MNNENENLDWYRVAHTDELPEGRVKTVSAGTQTMAVTGFDDYLQSDDRLILFAADHEHEVFEDKT